MHQHILGGSRALACALGLALTVLAAGVASGDIVGVLFGPDAPPLALGGIPMLPFNPDDVRGYEPEVPSVGLDVTNVPAPRGALEFDHPHNHRRIGQGWESWSHGYTGDVYYSNDQLSSTLTLPEGTRAFIFYVGSPNPGTFTVTATANDGTTVVQEGDQAFGFGFYTTGDALLTSITVTAAGPFAVGEFLQSIPFPELHVDPTSVGNCCWDFDLGQYGGATGDITQVQLNVLTPGATILNASPGCGGGPPPTVTATSATWLVPTGLVATYPPYGATCTVRVCLTSTTSSSIQLQFTGSGPVGPSPTLTRSFAVADPACNGQPPFPTGCDKLYTLDADFDQGTLLNVNHNLVHDQLQVSSPAQPLPYIAVACSNRGTVVRIDTNTGKVLGEYLTAPNVPGLGRNPSRTPVDLEGNVWVGNRDEPSPGSVVKIGLCIGGIRGVRKGPVGGPYTFTPVKNGPYVLNPKYSTCIDRDGDGLIRTSSGLGDILDWLPGDENGGAGGGPALVHHAEDEAILVFQRVDSAYVRHVSIDNNNDVWVGGWTGSPNVFDKLSGSDGRILLGPVTPGCGGYGGLIDCAGVLWSASPYQWKTWRFVPPAGPDSCVPIPYSYGLGIDTCGNIWNTGYQTTTNYSGKVFKIRPNGSLWGPPFPVPTGGDISTGLALNSFDSDSCWIANRTTNNVSRITNTGAFLATIPTGIVPTGVAVDGKGMVWVTNFDAIPYTFPFSYRGNGSVQQIDPAVGTVVYTKALGKFITPFSPTTALEGNPYDYSDMTGLVALNSTSGQGIWDVIQDSQIQGQTWGTITWNGSVEECPAGSNILIQARAAKTVSLLGGKKWYKVGATPGGQVTASFGIGQYIEVQAKLTAPIIDPNNPCTRCSPVLYDLRIQCCPPLVSIFNERILCHCCDVSGYIYSFDFQNLGPPLGALWFYPPKDVTITPRVVVFPQTIPTGGYGTVSVTIDGLNAGPGQTVCFNLNNTDYPGCFEHCITLPECDCIQILDEHIATTATPKTYVYTFRFANLLCCFQNPVDHVFLITDPLVATCNPDYFALSPRIPACNNGNPSLSGWLTTTITTTSPNPPPLSLCLLVQSTDCNCWCRKCQRLDLLPWGPPGCCWFDPCPNHSGCYQDAACSWAADCAQKGGVFSPGACPVGGGGPVFFVPCPLCLCFPPHWPGIHGIGPLGTAVVHIDDANRIVQVSDLGPTGEDGVGLESASADALHVDWASPDPFGDLPIGAYAEACGYGRIGGVPNQLLARLRATTLDVGVGLDADFTPVGAGSYDIAVYSGGTLVVQIAGHAGTVGTVERWPDSLEMNHDGAAAMTVERWSTPVNIQIAGGPAVVGDELRLTAANPTRPFESLGALELVAAGIPELWLTGVQVRTQPCAGDLNCDGTIDFRDIDAFVLALSDPAGYAQQYPNCRILNGDINGDGEVNYADVDPFVALLSSGATCP